MKFIIESERLGLREITYDDFREIRKILQDGEVMYAWEEGFSDEEIVKWINENIRRYEKDGFSYYAAIEKNTGQLIGVMGPLIENIKGKKHIGVAYILHKDYWNKGYASEGVKESINYAFSTLNAQKVIAQIRPNNLSSRKVVEKLGMNIEGEYIKVYKGKEMPHLIYSIEK
ncbi:RimJ/RimL family protein N-acetyltransferase [Natranaerovirga pectinivora]|uniref:RimJ/RimL family protein N-acetyltransferase n=1 Tax=Natranaerovirga pectinivora TaxID=682400 RepID=A0A4R3MNG7_9FIRM|nr:GNAT family N-acetyltransferase [Natranaerovirga pectinivora]TCT15584.1 RimJ/RimL family protein N-acetyltransferase [Natranaerovirga pectinivora]